LVVLLGMTLVVRLVRLRLVLLALSARSLLGHPLHRLRRRHLLVVCNLSLCYYP
jgi:hypothetical protein